MGEKMKLISGMSVQGNKGGGGSAHTPVEQADDLLSVAKLKMLLAVAEGEVQGDVTAQNIYLNDTPLANESGEYNFTGVKWEFRKGTQDQDYIQGLPEVNNESSVGITVTTSTPWVRQFSNPALDAVRVKLSLPTQYQYKDNGDMVGTVTKYAIDLSVDGGTFQQVVDGDFSGKTTTEYQRDHRINLPKSATNSAIRVRRISPDSSDSKLVNAFRVFSFAEVIDSKLRYPNTVLLYIEVDSSQFNGSAPKITIKMKGSLVKVPDNYDPVARTYNGAWSGGFKMAYTSNPAWVFYDLVLNNIYGMGNRIDASMIDKWDLYAVAQYCDEKVSNGAGATEPRFSCNVYIQSQEEAYTVLKDIAAIFRGMTYWGNEQIRVSADLPVADLEWIYTGANVINGEFNYAGGSYKNRYSSCQVSYSDPDNHYTDTVESVYESELISRYGVRPTQLTAIGCTSQSEAIRRGRWALLSNVKDGSVSFSVGLDGHIPLPTSVIGVADPYRAGKQNGGRISAVNGKTITLDREIDFSPGDRLIINLPDGKSQTRTISSIGDDGKTITVNTAYTQELSPGAVWIIDSDALAVQQFRVTSITDNDNGTFTIGAVQYDPDKFRYIDDGVRVQPRPITVTPTRVTSTPGNITVEEVDSIAQGMTVAAMQVSWDKVEGALYYVAQWRKDKSDWVNVGNTGGQGFTIQGIYSGVYDVRVRAVNAAEVSSPWGNAESVYLSGKVGKPGTPVNLVASDDVTWNINISWAFPPGSGDTSYTEIEVVTTADGQNPQLLAYVPYPGVSYQHGPLPAGVRRWYRARLIDKIGNKGDWTKFEAGASNADASDLIGTVMQDYLQSEDGKALLEPLITDPQALLENILAGYDTVNQTWSQYGENRAGIIYAQEVAASAEKSVAKLETDVVAGFEKQQAAIQEKMTAYADASGGSAIYTLKTGIKYNGQNYDAGIAVSVTVNGSEVLTRFAVNANQFVVTSGSGNTIFSPFIIKDGQVLINQAFIGNAWITNGMIGNFIQSNDYDEVANTGWNLNKSAGMTLRGGASARIRVIDPSNKIRVKLGYLR